MTDLDGADVDALLAWLPRLDALERPVALWGGGDRRADGSITMPYAEYRDAVHALVGCISSASILDTDYLAKSPHEIAADDARIAAASFAEVRAMLTWFVRGERFCSGHWGALIESGKLRRMLERLAALRNQRTA